MESIKKQLQEYHFSGYYAKESIEFINSCYAHNNEKELLKYGSDAHHIVNNLSTYLAGQKLGFSFKDGFFTEYGWFKIELLDTCETKINNSNKIKVAKGKNELWVHATSGSFGASGYGEPLNVFCNVYHKSKTEAEIYALKDILNRHKEKLNNTDTMNYKQSFIKKTIKLIELEISKRVNRGFQFSAQQPSFGQQMQLF